MEWNELQNNRLALITDLVGRNANGNLGRTALMKLCYFLQVLRDVPLGYRFTLYSYGPFDSTVLSDLSSAENRGAVRSETVYYPGGYGYDIRRADKADAVMDAGKDFLQKYETEIDWVAREFGLHTSAELEMESTIVYVDREAASRQEALTTLQIAQRVREIKPQFTLERIEGGAKHLSNIGLLLSIAGERSATVGPTPPG